MEEDSQGLFAQGSTQETVEAERRSLTSGTVFITGLGKQEVNRIAVRILAVNSEKGVIPVLVVGSAEQLPQPIRDSGQRTKVLCHLDCVVTQMRIQRR